jgi:hypothetical protein
MLPTIDAGRCPDTTIGQADHGHRSAHPVLSVEPTNGFGDSLQRCVERSSVAPTPDHTTRTWSISIQLANRTFVGFESPHDD